MNSLEEGFIRRSLKPRVDCDIPGRLRLSFARYAMLPEAAKPYLHYVEDVLKLLPGVLEVRLNPRIGTILVLYTPGEVGARQILRTLAERVRRQLVLRLPRTREEQRS